MKKELPSLILLDIMLPGEDGYGILTRLKSSPDTKNIPVIMVTAKDAEFDKVRGLEAGADDYITKPFGYDAVCCKSKSSASPVQQERGKQRASLRRTENIGGTS